MTLPLRLLLTADLVGGVWQYASDLAAALVPLGVAPTIALLGPANGHTVAPDGVALVETGLPLDWLSDGPEPVRAAARALAGLARDHDLVQLNSPTLAGGARYPVPVVAVDHGTTATWWEATERGPLPYALAWQESLAQAGLLAANACVAPTRAHAEAVRRRYGLPAVPRAVHNGRCRLAPSRRGAMHDFAFTAGRLWDRAKDVALLDRVAGRLSIPFYAAGPTRAPHGETIALAHIRAHGHMAPAALAETLSRRPVFVSAARFEPFGLAVLEAAAAGCPLVLSDLPGFRELWDGAATFVSAGDEGGFVAAIADIVGDEARRVALGQAAEARAARYTPEATAATMAALYREIVGRRKAAA